MTKSELKDIIFECILENNEEDLVNYYNEGIDLLEEEAEYVDILEEGANLEVRKIFAQYKKQYKEHLKAAKKYIKENNNSEAIKELKDAKDVIKQCKEEINKVEFSDKENFIGQLIQFSSSMGKLLIPLAISLVYRNKLANDTVKKYGKDRTEINRLTGDVKLKNLDVMSGEYSKALKDINALDSKYMKSGIAASIASILISLKEIDKVNKLNMRGGANYKNSILKMCDNIMKTIDKMIIDIK